MKAPITMIPLPKLVLCAANVRRTETRTKLEDLIASIRTHGLLQNLTVRAIRNANGKQTGSFEVIAGGRRLAALQRLADEGHLAKNYLVPCRVREEGDPIETSLAENIVRAPLHPADQFEAFATLHASGLSADEIAGRFGISPRLVEQRLKLAAVSPKLLAVYREGGMTLEQLMAFTLSDDHSAQERMWFESPLHGREPSAIRRMLTKALVEGTDRRARFIGPEAYEAAGGVVVRDLFASDGEGYFADSQLLDRLVAERLNALAEELKAEGWSWVEILAELDYGYLARMGRVYATPVPLPEKQQARFTEISEQYDSLIEEYGEDPDEEVDVELKCLLGEIDDLAKQSTQWAAEDKARTGALITLDYSGALRIDRGLAKPEDRKKKEKSNGAADEASEGAEDDAQSSEPETVAPLSEALVANMTAHRTAALRATLAEKTELALTALLHALVLQTFFGPACETCLDVEIQTIDLGQYAPGINESRATATLASQHGYWLARMPDTSALWAWLLEQDLATKLALLAYCIATTVNVVDDGRRPRSDTRLQHADTLAGAASLDMAEWWEPTKGHFLNRLSKAQIAAAVAEGVSQEAADRISRLKKEAMVSEAEALLAGKRWLPLPLRGSAASANLSPTAK